MSLTTVEARIKRHRRVRKTVIGTADRPRLCVYRSNRHIFAQLIDDATGKIILGASDIGLKGASGKKKTEQAKEVGKHLAEQAKTKKIGKVVFDRGGRLYHGRVKALAEGAREGGLTF
ncbi:MAG: 50S ribosomal protein L18 [Actinomycetota bacterium]